jgi:phosphohistidine phosphatase
MDLLVVRHAIAEDREVFAKSGKDDSERPLTPAGRRKFKRAACGLHRLVRTIDLLATSELVRAVETGDVLQRTFGIGKAARLAELAPEAPPAEPAPKRRASRKRATSSPGATPGSPI